MCYFSNEEILKQKTSAMVNNAEERNVIRYGGSMA